MHSTFSAHINLVLNAFLCDKAKFHFALKTVMRLANVDFEKLDFWFENLIDINLHEFILR